MSNKKETAVIIGDGDSGIGGSGESCASGSGDSGISSDIGGSARPDEAGASGSGATGVTEDYICLKVIDSEVVNEVHFRIKSATSLSRVKQAYCNKLGLPVAEFRFMFDGHRITDTDTPKSLGIVTGDVIEVYQERIGGGNL